MKDDPSLWWLETVSEIFAYAQAGDVGSAVESFAALCDYARDVIWPADGASRIGKGALRLVEVCCRRGQVEIAIEVYAGLRELEEERGGTDLRMERARCVYAILRLSRGRINTAERLRLFSSFVTDLEGDHGLMEAVGRVAGEVEKLLRTREEVDASAQMRAAKVAAKKVVRDGVALILARCPYCDQGLLLPSSPEATVFLCETCMRHFVLETGA